MRRTELSDNNITTRMMDIRGETSDYPGEEASKKNKILIIDTQKLLKK